MTDPVFLVARRAGQADRDAIWEFLAEKWAGYGWPVVIGHHDADEGPFNRAAATNRAAVAAGDWELGIIIDADVWVEPWQLETAIENARRTDRLSYAHTPWWGLSATATNRILDGSLAFDPKRWTRSSFYEKKTPLSNSTCMVVTRRLWDETGGYDERFQGWGAEDWAWFDVCSTLRGGVKGHRTFGFSGVERVDAPVYHFHHDVSESAYAAHHGRETPELARNHELGRRYNAAVGNVKATRALIEEAREYRRSRAVVGEHGPELTTLPSGAVVVP